MKTEKKTAWKKRGKEERRKNGNKGVIKEGREGTGEQRKRKMKGR